MSEADGLLHLLKAEPTLLDPAPESDHAQAIDHRRHTVGRICLRCGKPAHPALIADTELGPRFLDLCWECLTWLRTAVTE